MNKTIYTIYFIIISSDKRETKKNPMTEAGIYMLDVHLLDNTGTKHFARIYVYQYSFQ